MTKYILSILDDDGNEIAYDEFEGNPFSMNANRIELYRKRIDQVVDLYGKGLWHPQNDRHHE